MACSVDGVAVTVWCQWTSVAFWLSGMAGGSSVEVDRHGEPIVYFGGQDRCDLPFNLFGIQGCG